MPAPFTPPFVTVINNLITEVQAQTTAIQNLEATVASQSEHIERMSNFQRYMAESFYGANANIGGIWDGTDRYPNI